MTPTRWLQVDQLLAATLEQPRAERTAFLASVCDGDETLRQEVLSLLAGDEEADDFLEASPVSEIAELMRQPEAAYAPGSHIGPYRIVREIGRGGMGLVLLAVRDDDAFQKYVAIKLVAPGPLHTEVLRRFRRERQILADLDHPNIARLLDGGTTEQGWPYVVMEYVEGVPLTEYCRAQTLALNERLPLFRDVCAAVQYAHQHLIIHRDLKPANILVTADGVVKLLDFGIAKLLKPDLSEIVRSNTRTGALLMTPEYASPEQMRGATLTTASDVYSLGVLLYELLTEQSPYQLTSHALPDLIHAVCETEPALPSAVTPNSLPYSGRALRGDLDNIALTALHKDPARRYRTVNQMSQDIRRHLDGEVVFARQATFGYRLQRFVRRHRGPVSAAVLIALTLLGGIVSTWRQSRAVQAQARANRRLAYAGQMHLAMQAWELANLGQMRALIEQSKPEDGEEDLRGFEWYHLWQLAYRNGERLNLAHPEEVWATEYSPDGRRIVSACDDGRLRVWDAQTGKLSATFGHAETFAWDVAWSPDGKQIAAAFGDSTARLFDAATGNELMAYRGHTHKWITAVAFAPDGQRLATGSRDGTARVWETASGRALLTLEARASWVNTLAFSPDGKSLATGHPAKPVMKVWDAMTGRELRAFDATVSAVWSLAFAPDGQSLVTGHKDGAARLWELSSGQAVTLKGHRDEIRAVSFAPNGELLATASADRTVKLWDSRTKEERATLKGHTGQIWAVAFAPDSQTLASGDSENTVKVWQLAETLGFSARTHDLYAENTFALFSPDSQKLAVAHGTKLELVAAATGQILATSVKTAPVFTSVVFTPDGKGFYTGSYEGNVSVWDAATGREQLSFKAHTKAIEAIALSADGQTLATGSHDSSVKLWHAVTGQPRASYDDPASVRAILLSPDGQWLASAGHSQTVIIRELATGKVRATLHGHTKPILALALAPDRQTLASGSADGSVKLWHVATGNQLAEFKGPAGHVKTLSFSPDGLRLATGSSEGLVRLWDVATQQEVIALKVGEGNVKAVAFSPDGRMLVGTSSDPRLRIWRAATKQEIVAYR